MKALFITRKYPPILGGMERYSAELYEALAAKAEVKLVANRSGNRALPFFLLRAAMVILLRGRNYEAIHFADGLLACLIPLARLCSQARLTITIHGLDVTYDHPLYRRFVKAHLGKADRVIAISDNTRRLCLEAGLAPELVLTIPNGIAPASSQGPGPCRPGSLPPGWEAGKLLVTIGRFVKRKGQEWFIREVLTRLGPDYRYVLAGEGPEGSAIEGAISACGLSDRVCLLGRIVEAEKEWLLGNSTVFIMPNVPIKGDVEGFGLVLAEAASRGLWSVAARVDGIPDAVLSGATGSLVEPRDAAGFVSAIEAARGDPKAVEEASEVFAWEGIALRYLAAMAEGGEGPVSTGALDAVGAKRLGGKET